MSTVSLLEAQRAQGDQPPQKAPAPFNKPTANIIIRSSDNMDFYVQKAIMQEASPVFEDMFSLPQPAASTRSRKRKEREDDLFVGDIPVVKVTEDAATLHCLLLYCYPTKPSPPSNDELIFKVMEASMKYMMDGILRELTNLLATHIRKSSKPLHLYFLAIKYRIKEGVKLAAKACLEIDLASPKYKDPLMESISVGAYLRLLAYSQKCRDVGIEVLKERYLDSHEEDAYDWQHFLSIPDSDARIPYLKSCSHSRHGSTSSLMATVWNVDDEDDDILHVCKWFLPYVIRLAKEFAKCPQPNTIKSCDFSDCIAESAKICSDCYRDVPGALRTFRDKLAQHIREKQAKIEIEIVF